MDNIDSEGEALEPLRSLRKESLYKEGHFLVDSSESSSSASHPLTRSGLNWSSVFPILQYAKSYCLSNLVADISTSLIMVLLMIPQSLAFSALALLPSVMGITASVVSLIIYAFLGSSRHLSLGPDALSSLLFGVAISSEIHHHDSDPWTVATTLTLSIAACLLILWILKAGFIDSVLSGYLLTGHTVGICILMIVECLPDLLGVEIEGSQGLSTFDKANMLGANIHTAHTPTVIVGMMSILLTFGFKALKWILKKQYAWLEQTHELMIVFPLVVLISAVGGFQSLGIKTLGNPFDAPFRIPSLPFFSFEMAKRLFPDAITMSLVGYMESHAMTRKYSIKHGYEASGNKELFALGVTNALNGLFGGYAVFGSCERSKIQDKSGLETTLTGLFTGLLLMALFPLLAPILQHTPKALLSAIILNASLHLLELESIVHLFRMHDWLTLLFFLSTLIITLLFEIVIVIYLCLFFGILKTLRHTVSDIGLYPMGYHQGTVGFVNATEFSNVRTFKGILIVGISGPLQFYNAGQFKRSFEQLRRNHDRRGHSSQYEIVILDFGKCSELVSLLFRSVKWD